MLEQLKNRIIWAGEQAWVKGNLDAFDEVYAEDYLWHRPPFQDISGLVALKESVSGMRSAYSNIQITYDEMIGEGTTIAYRYTFKGKHTGISPSLPIPPTNKPVTLQGCVLVHISDSKIVEEFECSDYLGFLQQIDVVPPIG
ncbi:MAG: ester cyclase [Anaerolineae bacterium]|nr:ester cyclase [Anaerolineae bacterium]